MHLLPPTDCMTKFAKLQVRFRLDKAGSHRWARVSVFALDEGLTSELMKACDFNHFQTPGELYMGRASTSLNVSRRPGCLHVFQQFRWSRIRSHKADEYCVEDENGYCWMLLCRAALGKPMVCKELLIRLSFSKLSCLVKALFFVRTLFGF